MAYHVVIADDDKINLKAAELILSFNGYKVSCVSGADELMTALENNDVDLVMIDSQMSGNNGFEITKQVSSSEKGKNVPFVLMVASTDSATVTKATKSGAIDIVVKPFVTSVMLLRVKNTIEYFKFKNNAADLSDQKAQEVIKAHERIERLSLQVVQTLAGTIDAKDKYTNGHSSRVAEYAREIAKRAGYSEKAQQEIYIIGLLHDVGKIGISDSVINKPSKLTDEEYDLIKTHPMIGYGILKKITEMPKLAVGARWHHERYDGKGYPDGLSGTDIPEEARIIAVADSYDAMSSRRSYHGIFAQEYIKGEFIKGKGAQFDPKFADIMLEMITEDKNFRMREQYDRSEDKQDKDNFDDMTEQEEAIFTYISMLEAGGINTAIGLRYCMNDVDFFSEMLKEFTESAEDREKAIRSCIERSDFGKLSVYSHSLKSAANTVGAEELSRKAEKMEEAARKQDQDYINSNLEEMFGELRTTVGGILMAVNLYR